MKKQELENKIRKMENELEELRYKLANDFKNYQTIIILAPDIKLDDYYKIKDKIKDILEEIDIVEELGKKKLAYRIKTYEEGFYLEYKWVGNDSILTDIEKYFREEDNIIKFITINVTGMEE